MRQAQSSSTSFTAPSSVRASEAPAKDLAMDFAISSSRQRSPRFAPPSARSPAIVGRIAEGERDPIVCGTESILNVSRPNYSSWKPIAEMIGSEALMRAASTGDKWTVSGISKV